MQKTLVALAVGLAGCQTTTARTPVVGGQPQQPKPAAPASAHEQRPPVDPDVVAKAARPFGGVRVEDGELLSSEGLFEELARSDVVCVGEDHGDPWSHFTELSVIQALLERAAMTGRELGVGIEMLAQSAQPVLDRWRKGELDETELLSESQWRKSWGYDFAYYRPQLDLARVGGADVIALNLPGPLTRKVARRGLGALSPEEEAVLPALDLGDSVHRAWFERQMKSHPTPRSALESLYVAQVLRDEAMAETVCRWVGSKLPGRQLVVMAGAGHCRADAVPKRIHRRCNARVVGIRPILEGAAREARAEADGFDFLFSMSDP